MYPPTSTPSGPSASVLAARTLAFLVLASSGAVRIAGGEPPAPTHPHEDFVREIVVPYEEFARIAAEDPDGIIMKLPEYRALLALALQRSREAPPPALPPVAAVATQAIHTGQLFGQTVRVRSEIDVRVAREGWVRCDLGQVPEALGRVRVDGKPGWMLVESPVKPTPAGKGGAQAQKAAASKEAPPEPRAYLLVKGPGVYQAEIEFSLRASRSEDLWNLSGILPRAATSRLLLEVPGRAEATSPTAHVDTVSIDDGKATRLHVALGAAEAVALEWRQKRAAGDSDTLLTADHRITLLPRRHNPAFRWESTVAIRRRKAGSLRFREPEGAEVVRVSGPRVQSWQPGEGAVEVFLDEALLGEVKITFEGFLRQATSNGDRSYDVGSPALADAYSEKGFVAVADPAPERLQMRQVDAADEVSPSEATVPAPEEGSAPVARLYAFSGSDFRLAFSTTIRPTDFSYRAGCLVRILESAVTLDGRYAITVNHGRLYRFRLSLPAGWRLVTLEAMPSNSEKPAALAHDILSSGEEQFVEIVLERALETSTLLTLGVRLERSDWDADITWDERSLEVRVPALQDAESARIDLGISIADSMYIEELSQEGWQRLERGAVPDEGENGERQERPVRWRGLDSRYLRSLGVDPSRLAASLYSRSPDAPVTAALRHRSWRGEYQIVHYLLTLERNMRLRADVLLAVVDRPVDEIRLQVPVSEEVTVPILGDGVKEVVTEAMDAGPLGEEQSLRTVRFERPWVGSRRLRLEYEVALAPGDTRAIPVVRVLGPTGTDDVFHGEAGILFQSTGPVELNVKEGDGLIASSYEELPELGDSWKGGRVLLAYRVRERGAPGTFSTNVHPRVPLLATLVRQLDLTTVLGEAGVSRTRAELLLAYADREHLAVELPDDARLLAVEVDGESVQAVRPGGEAGPWSVPLPARSYARLVLSYERPDTSRGDASSLGNWGTWSENGPRFPAGPATNGSGPKVAGRGETEYVPVGATTWKLYHPRGYRFHVDPDESNLLSNAPEERITSFVSSFFGRLFTGRLPVFTVLRREEPKPIEGPVLAGAVAARETAPAQNLAQSAAVLQPVQVDQSSTLEPLAEGIAPPLPLVAEGATLELRKVGGEARLVTGYRTFRWWSFSKRALFLLTLVIGLWVVVSYGRRPFYRFALWGLVAGTLIPAATGWESPFLWIPFAEGLVALLVAAGVAELSILLARALRRWRATRRAAINGASALIVFAFLVAGSTASTEPAVAAEPADSPRAGVGEQAVIIPYDVSDPLSLEPQNEKVYLPYEEFRRLWLLAFPEEESKDPPVDLAMGNADYTLTLEDATYRLKGDVAIRVLTDEWVTLPLPFDAAQLVRIELDGAELGVTVEKATPVVAIRGTGEHRITLELSGDVSSELGVFSVATGLLTGPGTHVRAHLPRGARPESSPTSIGPAVREAEDGTLVDVDLGSTGRLELVWTFPKVAGEVASRLKSVSYSTYRLTLDGYRVERRERVQVAGRPLDAFEYTVLGDWEISEVQAPNLVEWSVRSADGERKLSLFFGRAIEQVEATIRGVARLGDARAQAATLSLQNAVQQESFFGLEHGGGKRWSPDVFTGPRAKRISQNELKDAFPAEESALYLLYHVRSSTAGKEVAAVPATGTITLKTEALALVGTERTVVSVTTRYRAEGPGTFREEVLLPAGWTVQDVAGEHLRSWEVVTEGGESRLVAHFVERLATGDHVTWSADLRYETVPNPLVLPALRGESGAEGVRGETVRWTVAAVDGLELSVADASGLAALPLRNAPEGVQIPRTYSFRFAFRTTGSVPRYRLALEASTPPSRLSAVAVLFARVREDAVLVNARVEYRVERGAVDRLTIRLPRNAELVAVEARNQRSREVRSLDGGRTEVELTLVSPVFEGETVELAYRLPRDEAGTPVGFEPVTLLDGGRPVAILDQYVGVVQGARQLVSTEGVVNLSTIPVERVPFLPEGVRAESLRPTYRATRPDWRLALREEALEAARELAATVKLAELVTVLANDGTLRTRATYSLRNRSLQFLEVELPAKAKLWGITVDGQPVLVSHDDRGSGEPNDAGKSALKVPLEQVGPGDPDLELVVVYSEPQVSMPHWLSRSIQLTAPRLPGTAVVQTLWHLELPEGYGVTADGGNMVPVLESYRYAQKVQGILQQIDDLSATIRTAKSERLKLRAESNLSRLEQALGDNVEDLEQTLQDSQEWTVRVPDQARQIAEGQLQLEVGRRVRRELQKSLQERAAEKEAGEEAAEGTFFEGFRFLENDWRGGQNAPRQDTPQESPDGAGAQTFPLPPDRPRDPAVETAVAKPPSGQGVPALARQDVSPITPGLESPPVREGQQSLTFRRQAGGAEIDVTVSPTGVWPRAGAWLVLLGILALLGWRAWQRWRP